MYAAASKQQQQAGPTGPADQQAKDGDGKKSAGGDTVDADFTVVDDDKDKK